MLCWCNHIKNSELFIMTDRKSFSTQEDEINRNPIPEVVRGFYEGSLLISTPAILDPRFHKAVIYMISHNEKGAMGLIINKPIEDLDFHEIVIGDAKRIDQKQVKQKVLFGGPVEFKRGFLLHSSEYYLSDVTVKLTPEYNLTNDTKALEDICAGKGPVSSLFTLGYAGWHAGQLEKEIVEDSWLVAKADPSITFGESFSEKYNRSLDSLGIKNAYLVNDSGNA